MMIVSPGYFAPMLQSRDGLVHARPTPRSACSSGHFMIRRIVRIDV